MAHLVRGERLSGKAPFSVRWTEKGWIINSVNFARALCSQFFFNFGNLAAERTGREVLAHSIYMCVSGYDLHHRTSCITRSMKENQGLLATVYVVR